MDQTIELQLSTQESWISSYRPVVEVRPARLFRVLHELELPESLRHTPAGMPEVRPMFPNQHVPFDAGWQRLSFNRNQPWLSPNKWTTVYAWTTVLTNEQGFGKPDDPRANYILNKDLTEPLPRVELLTCGGNVHTGYIDGDDFVVDVLNWRNGPPSVQWLKDHPWYGVYLVSMDSHGTPRRFPQGEQPNGYMADIVHPLMGDPGRFPRITMPKWSVVPWTASYLPDPYTLYIR